MNDPTQYVHDQLAAICPIDGISLGDWSDTATWAIHPAANATDAQKQAAQAWINAFNPNTWVPVPQSITRFQALAELTNAGLYDAALAAVTAAGGLTKLAWDNAVSFERDSPTIANLAAALKLTSDQLDQMFIQAAQIKA